MSFEKPTLDELAWHEAGHAYAYTALADGVPDELGLAMVKPNMARGWCSRGTILYQLGDTLGDAPSEMRRPLAWQAAAEIIVAVAGPLAECRYRNRGDAALTKKFFEVNVEVFLTSDALDTDGDFTRVRSCLSYSRPTEPARAFLRLVELAETILDENWSKIGRLAERLRKKRRLSAKQLDFWFERHEAQLYRLEPDILLGREPINGIPLAAEF